MNTSINSLEVSSSSSSSALASTTTTTTTPIASSFKMENYNYSKFSKLIQKIQKHILKSYFITFLIRL